MIANVQANATFEIKLSRRIWRVTLDGAFYGDYRARLHADESAEAAAAALRSQGHAVKIITRTTEGA